MHDTLAIYTYSKYGVKQSQVNVVIKKIKDYVYLVNKSDTRDISLCKGIYFFTHTIRTPSSMWRVKEQVLETLSRV